MDRQLTALYVSVMTALASEMTPAQIRAAATRLRNGPAFDDFDRRMLDEWADRFDYMAERPDRVAGEAR